MDVTRRMYADPGTASLLPALVAAIARSTRVAAAVRSGMAAAWNAAMRAVLERAIARGGLRADTDVGLTLELLAGPLFYRYLWLGAPIDVPYVRAVVASVLERIAARPRRASGGRKA
jgi:hypothetical protein